MNIYCSVNYPAGTNAAFDGYLGGYFNTTSALASVKFLMDTGNIDTGTIKMWGIK